MLYRPVCLSFMILWAATVVASATDVFRISVVDEQTGRGIPMVELTTVNHVRFLTDSAGVIVFDEPGLMNGRTFFRVFSHGYESPDGGYGARGRAFEITPGGQAILKLKRINIAERLYRVTGGGIYRDSVILGDRVPLARPVLNAGVLGSDSVENCVFQGQVYWFWGDTNLPPHPLGIFDVPGATSRLPDAGGLSPAVGVDLEYFVDSNGTAAATADMPGSGPTWISGLTVLRDADNRERLFASYAKIKPPLETYERGLLEFDVAAERFRFLKRFPVETPAFPTGHPLMVTQDGVDYVYFAEPFPTVRVRATAAAFLDVSAYEAYTCLQPGSTEAQPLIARDDAGVVRYRWVSGVGPLSSQLQESLLKSGALRPADVPFRLVDVDTGQTVNCHRGSVYWNNYRRRWVTIMLQVRGSSLLGEVWFAEADTPLGPWQYARKIVTHEDYSFYNPKQHPMFDEDQGRVIYFEGTYTHTFSGSQDQTPRYDYNQLMYRLNLADERLALPVPVYHSDGEGVSSRLHVRTTSGSVPDRSRVQFYALDRKTPATVPVYAHRGEQQPLLSLKSSVAEQQPAFFALPFGNSGDVGVSVPLLEFVHEATSERRYSTSPLPEPGFRKVGAICRVWPTVCEGGG